MYIYIYYRGKFKWIKSKYPFFIRINSSLYLPFRWLSFHPRYFSTDTARVNNKYRFNVISPWSWIEHDGKKRSGSWWKRRGRVKYNLRAHGLSFFLRGKKISPRNPNTFLSTRGAALKGLLQSIGRCRKGFDREREGRERRKKKIQKPSFYGKHQRIGGVSKFEGKKKRKLKFPSIHVSIANESVDIEIRRSRNVVANLSPPSPLRVKDDREGRYLLRRTDQDSILVSIHFETVCQSSDSNPTLWSFAMDLRLFPCPRQFRNPSCQSKRSNLFFLFFSFFSFARFFRGLPSFLSKRKQFLLPGGGKKGEIERNFGRKIGVWRV